MAKQIILYSDIVPNTKDNTHLFFNDLSHYKTFLHDYEVDTLSVDNYRIINNVLKCPFGSFDEEQIKGITYIIEEDTDTHYFKCYFVDSYDVQSGFAYFNLSVDEWGSNIHLATFNDIIVRRCNRNIETGVYDAPVVTLNTPVYQVLTGSSTKANENLYTFVFTATYVLEADRETGDNTQHNDIFAIPAGSIRTYWGPAQEGQNIVEIGAQIIGGIYKIKLIGNVLRNIKINNIYLLPSNVVTLRGQSLYVKSDGIAQDIEIFYAKAKYTNTAFYINTTNPNFKYYIGAKNNGLEVPAFTKSIRAFIRTNINYYGVNVIVGFGACEKDITKSFEVPCIWSTNKSDEQNNVAKYLDKIGGTILSVSRATSQAKQSNYLMAGASAIGAVSNALKGIETQANGTAGDGDAFITYANDITTEDANNHLINYPYFFTKYQSAFNENITIRFEGANFNNILVEDFAQLEVFDLLGTGDLNETYVEAFVSVEGIPTKAREIIKNKIESGIYYLCL